MLRAASQEGHSRGCDLKSSMSCIRRLLSSLGLLVTTSMPSRAGLKQAGIVPSAAPRGHFNHTETTRSVRHKPLIVTEGRDAHSSLLRGFQDGGSSFYTYFNTVNGKGLHRNYLTNNGFEAAPPSPDWSEPRVNIRLSDGAEFTVGNTGSALGAFSQVYSRHLLLFPDDCPDGQFR